MTNLSIMPDCNTAFLPIYPHDFFTLSALEGHEYVKQISFGNTLLSKGRIKHFELAHKRLRLGQATIDRVDIDCGASFEVVQIEEMGFYTVKLPLLGASAYRVDGATHIARPGHIFATNPVETVRKRFIGPYSQVIVTVPQGRLEYALSAELARPLREPLHFDLKPHAGISSDQLIRLVRMLWNDLNLEPASYRASISQHLEHALMVAMLHSLPNNYSNDLERGHGEVAPFYIRKAEGFILGNLGHPITSENIVNASGVSSRSLYYGFRRWRATTPMAYLKAARLDRAQAELLRAARAGGANVTDIALSVGYRYLNQFSSDYKLRFGKKPSDTLLSR